VTSATIHFSTSFIFTLFVGGSTDTFFLPPNTINSLSPLHGMQPLKYIKRYLFPTFDAVALQKPRTSTSNIVQKPGMPEIKSMSGGYSYDSEENKNRTCNCQQKGGSVLEK